MGKDFLNHQNNDYQLFVTETLLHQYADFIIAIDKKQGKSIAYSPTLISHFNVAQIDIENLSKSVIQQLVHPTEVHLVESLLTNIKTQDFKEPLVADVRLLQQQQYCTYRIQITAADYENEAQLIVTLKAIPAPKNAGETAKEKVKVDELAFIASSDLSHEYAKIQSIIQLLDNKYITDAEKSDLIEEAKKSIQIINSSIFKFNHKLSYSQTDDSFENEKKEKVYKKIALIDDDVLTNVLNKKMINTVVPDKPLHIFLNIDDALLHLKEKDTEGDYMIFLDINFPDRNGWDFLNEYKNYPIKSKVVVLSSSIDNRDREKARSYEIVVDYITKPLSAEFIKALFE